MAGFQEGTNIKKIKIGDDVRDIGADATNVDLKGVTYSGDQGKKLEEGLTNVVTHLKNLNDNNYKNDRIIIGNSNVANTNSIAIGNQVKATGEYSQAFGSGTRATDYGAHAEGFGFISGSIDFNYSGASGWYSHSENYQNNAKGNYSHAGGYQSEANEENSFVHGEGLVANNKNEFVIGQYNSRTSDEQYQSLFTIGGGNKAYPDNILQIKIPKGSSTSIDNPAQMDAIHVKPIFNDTTIHGNLTITDEVVKGGEIITPILKVTKVAKLPYQEDEFYYDGINKWNAIDNNKLIIKHTDLDKFKPYSNKSDSHIYIRKWSNMVNIEGQLKIKQTETVNYNNGFTLFYLKDICSPKIRLAQVCQGSENKHFLIDIIPSTLDNDTNVAKVILCRYGDKLSGDNMTISDEEWLPFNITYFVGNSTI